LFIFWDGGSIILGVTEYLAIGDGNAYAEKSSQT
jgi:hypothetical protein